MKLKAEWVGHIMTIPVRSKEAPPVIKKKKIFYFFFFFSSPVLYF